MVRSNVLKTKAKRPTKLLIIHILEILKKYSDKNNAITQATIMKELEGAHQMKVKRQTVADNLNALIENDMGVTKAASGKGYYYIPEFSTGEIRFLVDAVFSSKNISTTDAKTLAEKITMLGSDNEGKRYRYIYKSGEISRAESISFFANLDTITEAIEKGKKVEFNYHSYGIDGKLKPRYGGKVYTVSPYFFLHNNGNCWLICTIEKYEKEGKLANYRVDFMADVKLSNKRLIPKSIDIPKFASENPYMFGGRDIVTATIKLNNEFASHTVFDRFGTKIRIRQKPDDTILADITVTEKSLIYLALQYGEEFEVVSPVETRDKIKEKIKQIKEKYE